MACGKLGDLMVRETFGFSADFALGMVA